MTDLYSLNKDMLVKLVATIKEESINQLSNKQLREIISERKRMKKVEILKRCLLELKNIPYMKNLIESHEEEIRNIKELKPLDFFNDVKIREYGFDVNEHISVFSTNYESYSIGKNIHVYENCEICNKITLKSYDKKGRLCIYKIWYYKGKYIECDCE